MEMGQWHEDGTTGQRQRRFESGGGGGGAVKGRAAGMQAGTRRASGDSRSPQA